MPKKETFTSRFEETRGGRVPQKSKIWGDVVYGWSLIVSENINYMGYGKLLIHTVLQAWIYLLRICTIPSHNQTTFPNFAEV